MITELSGYPAHDGTRYVELYALSTDTKPTQNISNGSSCVEIDTGKVYLFNEAASVWVEVQ